MVVQSYEYTELYSLNGWIVWCMNYISIKVEKKKIKKKPERKNTLSTEQQG